jgi:arylsulfatase A-like enzyme
VPRIGVNWAMKNPVIREKLAQYHKERDMVWGCLAAITFADAQIGLILDALDQGPHADNTIVVLLGDNGHHYGEKLHWGKQTLWEESTHIPLIISHPPGNVLEGRCLQPVSLIDLYPTLVEMCGLPSRPELEGVSLCPLLKDPNATWKIPAIVTYLPNNHCVRYGRWSYIRYHDGSEELYDIRNDRLQWYNLARGPRRRHVKQELARFLPKVNAPRQ